MLATTLKELRGLAKKLGLRGYSELTKGELQQRLQKFKIAVARVATSSRKAPVISRKHARPRAARPTAAAATARTTAAAPLRTARAPEPLPPEIIPQASFSTQEERVEGAKFTRYSRAPTASVATADLGEDIDRLPSLRQSTLCVLPQKPGVLHAYWALADGDGARGDLKLRLCHGETQALQVWDEVAIAARRGHWYFHVPEIVGDDAVLLQLGYYEGEKFVSALRRGIARIPNLYASARTDRWWWIDEDAFRDMYLRAGGATLRHRLGWPGSISSPSAPDESDQRLRWPGGVSSRAAR